ncbi:MAG TPA: hypothetical protein VK668_22805 [Mucilaginibacter sp.]|nr:hypothetical protein [Mucilaginibacter sp.]
MVKRLLLLLILLGPKFLLAQSYEKEYVTLFAWEVKQIDEFVERFDNSDSTLIKQYNQKHDPSRPLTREKLIKSLFNAERKDWNFSDITTFIKQVDNKDNPVYLDFYNGNWYANVNCAVVWKGKPLSAMFKLKIEKLANGGYKWVITDVDAKFLSKKNANGVTQAIDQPVLPKPENKNAALNPMSHAIDFLNIDKVSDNSKNIGNYLATSDKYSDELCVFINECINNRLKIINVKNITYSCSQVKGWSIEIKQYNRQTKNSGWLISKLKKVSS